ncbi:efflux RND transporter periplasmic adaptor subunit [Chloroflexi bacterium TSY]|nr:efflux RND transporter periplasmic adaptor subunit [Chloroflexi bacterium TSY]
MSPEAAELQNTTIDYESAKASFDQANKPASKSDMQAALSAAQSAQDQFEQLKLKPTLADLAAAEATVADAAERLRKLTNPSESDMRTAELNVKKAMIRVEEARTNLRNAQLLAPISGTVLSIHVEPGQSGTPGMTAITLADTSKLKLTINVAEVDIPRIELEQEASVKIDALRGDEFAGRVDTIAPSSKAGDGVVNYAVTIHLTDLTNVAVRPGMTAEATLQQDSRATEDQWLVPNSALQSQNGQTIVQVQRGDALANVAVVPGEIHGEWTMVQTDELGVGDQVVGQVASFVVEDAVESEEF